MNWIDMKIEMDSADIELAMGALMAAGINGFAIQDPREFSEFLEHTEYYDYIEEDVMRIQEEPAYMTVYLPENAEGKEMLEAAKAALDSIRQNTKGTLQYTLSGIAEEDWANNWKQYFKPLKIGRRIWIKPSWEALEDAGDRIVLEIDPSSSFGTGTHATTQLCMELLEKHIAPECTVLDMGCGSGILSVAALLLGAGSVEAVDIEENACATARENARRNGLPDAALRLHHGNVLEDGTLADALAARRYDVIVANIVADVIIAMSPLFRRLLALEGRLIASGIITERMEDVSGALEQCGLHVLDVAQKDDWAALTVGLA